MNIWEILGIESTNDISEIKKAYANRSKEVHPEEHPEEFKQLHNAYKTAIKMAKNQNVRVPIYNAYENDAIDKTEDLIENYEENQEEKIDFDGIIEDAQENDYNVIREKTDKIINKMNKMDNSDIVRNMKSKWIDFMCSYEFQELIQYSHFAKRITNFFNNNTKLTKAQLCGIEAAFSPEDAKDIKNQELYSTLYLVYFASLQANANTKKQMIFPVIALIEFTVFIFFMRDEMFLTKLNLLVSNIIVVGSILYMNRICKNQYYGITSIFIGLFAMMKFAYTSSIIKEEYIYMIFLLIKTVVFPISTMICAFKLKKQKKIKMYSEELDQHLRFKKDAFLEIRDEIFGEPENFEKNTYIKIEKEKENEKEKEKEKENEKEKEKENENENENEEIFIDTEQVKEITAQIINNIDNLNKNEYKRSKIKEWEKTIESEDFKKVKNQKYFKQELSSFIIKTLDLAPTGLAMLEKYIKPQEHSDDYATTNILEIIYSSYNYGRYLRHKGFKKVIAILFVSLMTFFVAIMLSFEIKTTEKLVLIFLMLIGNVAVYYCFKICSFYKRGILISFLSVMISFLIFAFLDNEEVLALTFFYFSTFLLLNFYYLIKLVKENSRIKKTNKKINDIFLTKHNL